MASLSVSPILAPVFGGLLVQFTSWRLIFVVLCGDLPRGGRDGGRGCCRRRIRRHAGSSARPLPILLTYGKLLATRGDSWRRS